jgi:starvation-inducible DNA-binding protein
MMQVENAKNQFDSEFIPQFLSKILIDEYVLFLKTKSAFWNYECNVINGDNNLFEGQSKEIDSLIDQIAKRIMILNDVVQLTYKDISTIVINRNKKETAKELLADNLKLIKTIKEWNLLMPLSGYYDTKNLIQKLMAIHQVMADNLRTEIIKIIENDKFKKR